MVKDLSIPTQQSTIDYSTYSSGRLTSGGTRSDFTSGRFSPKGRKPLWLEAATENYNSLIGQIYLRQRSCQKVARYCSRLAMGVQNKD